MDDHCEDGGERPKEYCERLLFPLLRSSACPSVLFQKLPSDRQQLIIPEFLGPTIYLSFPSRSWFIPPPTPLPLVLPIFLLVAHRCVHSRPTAVYIVYVYTIYMTYKYIFKYEWKTKKQYCLLRLG